MREMLDPRRMTTTIITVESTYRCAKMSVGTAMVLKSLSITNFKGLRGINVPASRFVCVIGANNAGKSTLLRALLLFVQGDKITPDMYFDRNSPVTISLRIESITEQDLLRIPNEEHRKRFGEILSGHAVTLVRRYDTSGASRLRRIARVPTDTRFEELSLDSLISGKKPGTPFAEELAAAFPEIADKFSPKTNQTQARALISQLADEIPDDRKCDAEMDLPSGIDNSIKPFLPEPIYIPAVKDLADEIATKDSASFGKLLGILLAQIEPDLKQEEETFKHLRRMLNRTIQDDGSALDQRLEAVRNIETLVQQHVRENFANVEIELRIPPPEIKAILSSAEIWVNDGVIGAVGTKGDGLKRTVTLAILRSYVELRRIQKTSGGSAAPATNNLLLFEEPELYLHPTAQRILFDALSEIAETNHVFVSTHSPLFFGGDATKTFIKLVKKYDATIAQKPFAQGMFVDLSDLNDRNRFQIISYETNNSAFFSDTVVLVEGDSDLIIMPHIARVLNPAWDSDTGGTSFCRIGGKGNISKYRDFFCAFNVTVSVITDLDCLLDGFDLLEASPESAELREDLIRKLDQVVATENIEPRITSRSGRELQARRDRFKTLYNTLTRFKEGTATEEEVIAAEEQFFGNLEANKRLQALRGFTRPEITAAKQKLILSLRKQHIHVLEKGEIEDYYPDSVKGPDKTTRAIDFCAQFKDREALLTLCGDSLCLDGKNYDKEFTILFASIFEESERANTQSDVANAAAPA